MTLSTLFKNKIFQIGLGVMALVLAYLFLVTPLEKAIDTAEQQYQNDHALLEWMKPRIEFLKKQEALQPVPIQTSRLLPLLQESIEQSRFKTNVVEIIALTSQPAVQIKLKAVNFDQLLTWLAEQKDKHGFEVSELSALATQTVGVVDVTFVIGNPVQ